MRIGLFAHSTNPRGGVVHAIELAEALTEHGHDATIIAPDTTGKGFFRRTRARQLTIPVSIEGDLPTLVERRIDEIASFFQIHSCHDHDVWHAHCSITANALARLADSGRIGGFVRTVHHLDAFADTRLAAWQRTGIERAGQLFAVSRHGQSAVEREFGRRSAYIGNGVDRSRFTPTQDRTDAVLADRLGIAKGQRPVFLAVGGVEARKNTTEILRAFLRIHAEHPGARLIVAGGASLLDHRQARAEFAAVLNGAGAASAVMLTGPISDVDMPALYRLADALVFVSLREGFGLCPLEAMACGTPAIVSAIPPFNEHFTPDDCLWADPNDPVSIETAMRTALAPAVAATLSASGPSTAARFAWPDIARRQLDLYRVGSFSRA